ncbi:hypothetical protein, partial [Actinokineospora inagensis]
DRMVADTAPRLFAIAQQYGTTFDGEIIAWGLKFRGRRPRCEIVSPHYPLRMSLEKPETALHLLSLNPDFTPHLIWHTPHRR